MNELTLALVVICVAVVAAVLGYNIYQERKFREQMRQRFGGLQDDVLLQTPKNQVRDGQEGMLAPSFVQPQSAPETAAEVAEEAPVPQTPSLFDAPAYNPMARETDDNFDDTAAERAVAADEPVMALETGYDDEEDTSSLLVQAPLAPMQQVIFEEVELAPAP